MLFAFDAALVACAFRSRHRFTPFCDSLDHVTEPEGGPTRMHVLMQSLFTGKNLSGLIASLGCLLTVGLLLAMLAGWDNPDRPREPPQRARDVMRGLFDDLKPGPRDHH